MEEATDKEETEEDMVQPNFGEEEDLPPPLSMDDSNSEIENFATMHEPPSCDHVDIDSSYYTDESDDDMLMDDFVSPINNSDNNEECVLDMLYDNALDDGPVLLDDPPCLTMIKNSCEDRYNDKLPTGQDDTLIHESPTSFLNSPIFTTEEKYVLCEKYMHGLKLLYENPIYNHDVNIDIIASNYF